MRIVCVPACWCALGLAVLTSCGRPGKTGTGGEAAGADGATAVKPVLGMSEAQAMSEGQAIVRRAFETLSGKLTNAIAAGGYAGALPACSVEAGPLTEAVGSAHEVQLRRVTHRARNPANRANADELALLEQFRAGLATGGQRSPVLRTNAAGARVFYAPIVIENVLCLNCHGIPGQTLRGDVAALVKPLYPQDEAVGFSQGDLRGLWRVEFPPVRPPPGAASTNSTAPPGAPASATGG